MNLPRNKIRLSITSSCNMQCVYCHNEGNCNKSMLSVDDIDRIVQSALNFGLEEVRLTGGDPLTHPEFNKICELLHDKYHLRISINTNLVAFNKVKPLIEKGWINRLTVGLDYFDAPISKNSPIGFSSEIILERVKKVQKLGCNVSIDTVFDNNYDSIIKIVEWCIKNGIRVKIIEIEKNEICSHSNIEYLKMQKKIMEKFAFDNICVDELEEYNCYINGKKLVSFFPSLCRLRKCHFCRRVQLRITSTGVLKNCLYYDDIDENILLDDVEEINKKFTKVLTSKVNYHMDESLRIR